MECPDRGHCQAAAGPGQEGCERTPGNVEVRQETGCTEKRRLKGEDPDDACRCRVSMPEQNGDRLRCKESEHSGGGQAQQQSPREPMGESLSTPGRRASAV